MRNLFGILFFIYNDHGQHRLLQYTTNRNLDQRILPSFNLPLSFNPFLFKTAMTLWSQPQPQPQPQPQSQPQPGNLFNKLTSLLLLGLFLLVVSSEVIESKFLIKTLPGLSGELNVSLETGYIGVGESDDVQLFYYFVESEGSPDNDPIMFMLSGGPGCSGLTKIVSNTGPFNFNYANSTPENPVLEINSYSWTKVANIISIDQPAGTGFSYAKYPKAYITNDTLSSMLCYQFLRKWLDDHPRFIKNPLYVGADSYGGLFVPLIVQQIYKGNEVGEEPHINIKGYVIGNPVTDTSAEYNFRIPSAHHLALLSDAVYKSAKRNCRGEYLNVDSNNILCIHDLNVVEKCLKRIQMEYILDPYCGPSNTFKPSLFKRDLRSIEKTSKDIWSLHQVQMEGCNDDIHMYPYVWANRRDVREALHIREVFNETEWVLCNGSLQFFYNQEPISYTHNIWSTVAYHRHLANKNCRALVYSGDQDMIVSYLSTLNWIKSLNLLLKNDWGPWFVDEQVAGYTMKYSHNDYNLTFATVKMTYS
ncbi:serine carboxypeptidase-like 17 isoform X2 [Lactuca sativa]|uniref:serine carboxypeptidase-like 17 isoform X2 n=1 Tax=Lactuca sativa TaxID=4236 RepID=UPI0022AF5E2B|nr:serine carboxypeptidase-like 17 isoform X2 [Lactuca sativa]